MTTSKSRPETAAGACPDRKTLRLNLTGTIPGRGSLDGLWWPHSRDLETEAAELVDNFPGARGRVEHVEYSAPHWTTPDREISTAHGHITAAVSRRDDAHVVVLTMSTGRALRLLVLPPGIPEPDARLIMDHSAPDPDRTGALLTLAEDGSSAPPEPTADERWVDYGDEFWGPNPVPPSERAWRPFSR